MNLDDKKLKEILIAGAYVSAEDFEKVEYVAKERKIKVIDALMVQGYLNKDLLGQALAESMGVVYADLNSKHPSIEQIKLISEKTAKNKRVVVFDIDKSGAVVATDKTDQKGLVAEMKKLLKKKKITIAYSLPEDIDSILVNYRKKLESRFDNIYKKNYRVAPEMLDEIFEDALLYHASDIHFEPQAETVILRFRVDGILQDVGHVPKDYYANIINRIKVQANLRVDEHFAAQDGALRFVKDGRMADMRVSIVPTLDGEKIVIRVLSRYVSNFTMTDLGFSSKDQVKFLEASTRPFGMILATGPTGSGKSTTLYALLKLLNRVDVNITTIEDPVEYKMTGVNQIQVNQKTGLTFAKGLRSIVRQDPDIILVGEIRDEETAEIAVNSALTGHLLLSTFHANDAATAIPRLLEMNIEPFLLASTLEVVIAQRLVRRICEGCRTSHKVSINEIKKIVPNASKYFKGTQSLYKGKGCQVCKGTGYKGRTAIFELIVNTKEIGELILNNPTSTQIWDLAKKQGSRSMYDDGMEKVKAGVTTIEEVNRVAIQS